MDLSAERFGEPAWGWVQLEMGAGQLPEVVNDPIPSHMVLLARPRAPQLGRSGAAGG